jgi:DNA-binding CsgD family transcriptional regulator
MDLARERFSAMLAESREAGEASGEADLLTRLAETELYADRWSLARSYADEAAIVAQQEGQTHADPARRVRALIDAHEGRVDAARVTAEAGLARVEAAEEPILVIAWAHVLAFVGTCAEEPAVVVGACERADAACRHIGISEPLRMDGTPEWVEALVALGRLKEAERLLQALRLRAQRVPRPWADAAIARGSARVLAAQGRLDDALAATDPVTTAAATTWRPFDVARTLLVRGEVLRAARSRRESGATLEAARTTFEALGAVGWAARAQRELDRLGRRRSTPGDLTATERRVAELAASGLRNREVAEALGISAKTVEAHLARVYDKLGIRSRAELGRAMPGGPPS